MRPNPHYGFIDLSNLCFPLQPCRMISVMVILLFYLTASLPESCRGEYRVLGWPSHAVLQLGIYTLVFFWISGVIAVWCSVSVVLGSIVSINWCSLFTLSVISSLTHCWCYEFCTGPTVSFCNLSSLVHPYHSNRRLLSSFDHANLFSCSRMTIGSVLLLHRTPTGRDTFAVRSS